MEYSNKITIFTQTNNLTMQDKVKVLCQNTATELEVEMGITLGELLSRLNISGEYPILAAYVNNRIKELNYKIYKPIMVRFIDITHFEGYRVYQRTISFILQKAAADIFPERKLYIRHSLGRGLYGEFADNEELSTEDIEALRRAMQQIIDTGYTITRQRMLSSEINEIFKAAQLSQATL